MTKKKKQQRCKEQSGVVHEYNGREFIKQCLHVRWHPGDHLFVWKRVQ